MVKTRIPVFKKEDKKEPKNYRGIPIFNPTMNLFQNSRDCSTLDKIFVILQIILRSSDTENKRPFYTYTEIKREWEISQQKTHPHTRTMTKEHWK